MKCCKLVFLIVIIVGLPAIFIGCGLLGITIGQRIEAFESDLNEPNRDDAYLNFHPDTSRTLDYLETLT
jgi:hypothetical protein